MAAASPTFPTSRETTNYARLCVLLVDVSSQVLRGTFDRIRPRGRLDTVLGTPPTSDTLKSLLKRKVLNPSQWSILYPSIKSSVSSEKLDITLLMVLLRNICGLTPPAAGWDALPSPTDVNCEDDLARIKYYRNTVYGHAAQASVDDANFNNYWMKIRDTLVRLGGVAYEAAIDVLEYDNMDPDMEEHYIEMLKQWKVDDDVIEDKLNNVEAKVDNVQASVDRIETQLLQKSFATNVVINIENITLHGRVINIRDLADSCRMYQAADRSGETRIILITQEEQEQAEGVEGTVSGQSQVYQQYVPTENSLWDVVLSVRNRLCAFYNHLQYGLRVLVRGHHLGSLTITVECSSLQTLEGLWNDYTSGHLEEVAQEVLVTSDVLKTLGIAGMKLKTFISEEQYEKGKKEFVENLGQPDTEQSCYLFMASVESGAPTFPSSRETTNYTRLCRLLVGVGSQVLRETFDRIHPPRGLDTVLATTPVHPKLQSLQKKKVLNPLQWDKLYPVIKTSVSSKNFDITLLMVLLRNICGLTPPATGWDNLPLPTDLSCEADIARIKYYRNTVYAHATQASVDDATFDYHWKNIRDTLVRLGGAPYEAAVDDLKYDSLDPDMEEHYKGLLRQWKMDEDSIKDKLDDVEAKIDELQASVNKSERQLWPTSEMDKIKLRSELPEKEPNINGREKEIDDIVQALVGKSCTTLAGFLVTGTAGVGKSTVAIQAGYRLKDEFGATVKYCSLRGAYKGGREDESVVREILNVCVPGNYQGTEYPKHVLLNWCRQLDNEMILIIDNVEDVVEGHDKDWFLNLLCDMRMRSVCKMKFLITSSLDVETVGTASNILLTKLDLGPLDVAESIEILKDSANLTSNTDTETKAKLRQIAEICENIPLALRLAGPLLAMESEYTFDGLKQKLEQNPARTLGVKPIMEIAFEKLDESLQHALVYLSVLPQSFKRDAAEAILGDDCAEALTNLKKRCLIQKQDDRYLIHLLIRGYAKQIGQRDEFRQILVDGKQGYLKHFLTLILRNSQVYWGKDTCKESFQLFNEERINIEYILQEVAGGPEKVQNCKELEDVVHACGQVAPYIEDCVPFKLYGDFLNGLLQFSRIQRNKTKQVEILFLLYDESRRQGGDMEKSKNLIVQAVKLHDDNLHLFERNRLSKALFLTLFGRYLSQDNNRRDEAERRLQQALAIVEKEGDEHASIFDIGRVFSQMGHIARLGKDKKGKRQKETIERRKEALTYFQEALRFRQTYYGEHVVTALAHKDLAGHYLAMEDFRKAKENYEAAVRIFEGMGMMKQKEAIPTYKNFATCYEKIGRIDQARRLFEMGSEVAENTIEGNHKWKVEINTNLALLLYRNYPDEVRKAKELAKNVFSMAKELKMEKWIHRDELKALYQKG